MGKKISKKALDKIAEEKARLFSEDINCKVSPENFQTVIRKCIDANVINFDDTKPKEEIEEEIEAWYRNKFKPFVFEIDMKTYLKSSVEALKIQHLIAGTDFGSSRQRDFGQKWSDTIRGYLGEFGVKQWIEKNYPHIKVFLGHEEGSLKDYLPQDIHKVEINGTKRDPNLKISIKSAKFNGLWMDIPGDQFSHSDVFILAKIFISDDHLFSFFKEISVFKDKILKCGIDENCINEEEAQNIFDHIPSFKPVIGYIAGFIVKEDYINRFSCKYEYSSKITKAYIYNYEGEFDEKIFEEIKEEIKREAKKLNKNIKNVVFEGIGNFSKQKKYIFGMKSLKYKKEDWEKYIINKL